MVQHDNTTSIHQDIDGFLKHRSDWSERVAAQMAEREGLTLTDKHWDIIQFIRTEFYANNGDVPLVEKIKKGMEREWNSDVPYTELTTFFPGGLSRQAAKIAGCITLQTVSDFLAVKGDYVWSIEPDRDVLDALKLMSEKNIGALMVVEKERLVGLLSERDYTRDVALRGHPLKGTKVRDIMSNSVSTVAPTDTLDQCMALMTERRFRHLPVLDGDRLVGVLSMPDLVRIIVQQQEFTIAQLEHRLPKL